MFDHADYLAPRDIELTPEDKYRQADHLILKIIEMDDADRHLCQQWINAMHDLAWWAARPDCGTQWQFKKEGELVNALRTLWPQVKHWGSPDSPHWAMRANVPDSLWSRHGWIPDWVDNGPAEVVEKPTKTPGGNVVDTVKTPARTVEIEVHRDMIVCIYPGGRRKSLMKADSKAPKSWDLLTEFATQDNSHAGHNGRAVATAKVRSLCKWLGRTFELDGPDWTNRSIGVKSLVLIKERTTRDALDRKTIALDRRTAEMNRARDWMEQNGDLEGLGDWGEDGDDR